MAMRSIYHKTCPTCATLVEVDVKRCTCGYSFEFESQAPESDALPEDMAVQDEELLKEYLDARISQAVSELQVIQSALASDPKNLEKANKLLGAFAQVRELRTELETQTAKLTAARDAARAARLERGMEIDARLEDIPAAPISTEPTDAFRAAQSAKAENIMHAAGMETKACPKCRNVLPAQAALCFCGHTFSHPAAGSPGHKHSAAAPLDYRKTI